MADHLITGVVVQCGHMTCLHTFTSTLYPAGPMYECPQCHHRAGTNLEQGLDHRLATTTGLTKRERT